MQLLDRSHNCGAAAIVVNRVQDVACARIGGASRNVSGSVCSQSTTWIAATDGPRGANTTGYDMTASPLPVIEPRSSHEHTCCALVIDSSIMYLRFQILSLVCDSLVCRLSPNVPEFLDTLFSCIRICANSASCNRGGRSIERSFGP